METYELKKTLDNLKTTLDTHIDLQIDDRMRPYIEAEKKNQQALDNLLAKGNERSFGGARKQAFGDLLSEAISEKFNSNAPEIKAFQNDRDAKLTLNLKLAGTMTVGANLTGDGVASYGSRQGLVPNQKINARDLVPTVGSPTGIYVTYRETGGEGAITEQVEGESKAEVDYDFTEIKNVQGYVAGFCRFSKQMMYQLPWLQSTLPRILLRDFYKKENNKFYTYVATNATGYNTTGETDDAKAIIDVLMGRADRDFNNSFILVKNSQVGRILKLLYTNGFYMGSGSVVGTPQGNILIANTPLIGVSWALSDKLMVIDSDFIERVETESLRVEFSYEDNSNFTKNLVTARVECMEDFSMLRLDAHSYLDLGNS